MTWVCLWADGLEWCDTHKQAEALAEQILDDYRADAASDGWPDEADQVCVLRVVSQSDIVERGEGDDGEEWVDYGMRSVEASPMDCARSSLASTCPGATSRGATSTAGCSRSCPGAAGH